MRLLAPLPPVAVLMLAACTSVEDGPTPGPGGEAGAPVACLPSETLGPAGDCISAGVPADRCGDGFMAMNAGCAPVLPASVCPPGLMATPGEDSCREVAPCPASRFGDAPIEPDTQHVDGAYAGGSSDGSEAHPWTTVQAAVDAVEPGGVVAVAEGTYVEDVIVRKPVRLWGRCPGLVVLSCAGADVGALILEHLADGTEIHDVQLTGLGAGIAGFDASEVLIERVWIHDTESRGVSFQNDWEPPSFTMRGSLIENASGGGILMGGGHAVVEGSVVRATMPGSFGPGLGIVLQHKNVRASGTVRDSLVELNHAAGLSVLGSDVVVQGSVIRDTQSHIGSADLGRGIILEPLVEGTEASSLVLRGSVLERNREIGVFLGGGDALIEGSTIRDTLPQEAAQTDGRGLALQVGPAEERAAAIIRSTTVERCVTGGIFSHGADLTLESVVVRDISSQVSDLLYGRGVQIQPSADHRPTLTMRGALIERAHDLGVSVTAVDAVIDGLHVRETATQPDGSYGDGLIVWTAIGLDASAAVTRATIEASARAGVAVFGAHVSLTDTMAACNLIDLNGEPLGSRDFTLTDLGANTCGCGDLGDCVLLSSGLAPPAPLQ